MENCEYKKNQQIQTPTPTIQNAKRQIQNPKNKPFRIVPILEGVFCPSKTDEAQAQIVNFDEPNQTSEIFNIRGNRLSPLHQRMRSTHDAVYLH